MAQGRRRFFGSMIVGILFIVLVSLCGCDSRLTETSTDQDREAQTQCPGLWRNQTCCGGRAYEKDPDRVCCNYGDDRVYVFGVRCHNGYTDDPFEVCGTKKFDNRYQDCCAGQQPYDRKTKQCCTGNGVSNVVALRTVCCNGVPMEQGELCCWTSLAEKAVRKRRPSDTKCCVHPVTNAIKAYDPKVKVCYQNGEVSNLPGLGSSSESHVPPVKEENSTHAKYPRPLPPNFYSKACLKDKGQTEDGEELECCGTIAYRPSQKTCCREILYSITSKESVCCYDTAYHKNNTSNPCMRKCGGKLFNSETQMCCGGKVRDTKTDKDECCGNTLINPDRAHCCAGMSINKRRMACCQSQWPYYPNLLKCNKKTGSVEPRKMQLRAQNLAKKFCTKRLETWGEHWRSLILRGLLQLQGRVESCSIRFTKHTVTISLTPAITKVGGERVSDCMRRRRLKLQLYLPDDQPCLNKSQAKRYLRDKTLDIFVPIMKLDCSRRTATLRLRNGDVALVLVSRRMDTMLVESFLQTGS